MFGFCKINFLNFFFVWSIVFFHLRLAFFGGSSTSSTSSSPTTASALKATTTKQKCPFKFMFTNNHAALSQHSLRMLHKGHLFPSQPAGTSQATSGPARSTSSIAEHVESQAMGSGMTSTNNALNQRFHAWRQYQYHAASTALGFASTALSDFDTICHFSPSSFESYLPVSSHSEAMENPAKQSLKQRSFRMKSSPHHHRHQHSPSLSALFASSSAMVDTQETISSSSSSSFCSSSSANTVINNNNIDNNDNLMNALSATNVVLSTTPTTKKNLTDAASLEIVALGLSHHNAKVEIREQLAIPEDQWQQVARELCALPAIQEAAILSTCNRFEVYLSGEKAYEVMREAMQFLVKRAQAKHAEKVKRAVEENGVYEGVPCLDLPTLRRSLFLLSGEDAIWHLLKVSAGLDSLVIGEGQILAQVKKAYEHATNTASSSSTSSSSTSTSTSSSETVLPKSETVSVPVSPAAAATTTTGVSQPGGKVIARLLNAAVAAGKRVRSETGISKGAVSISSAAAEFTHWKLPTDCHGKRELSQAKIVVVGAGKMARLLLVHLSSSHQVRQVTLVVRSVHSENVRLLQAEFPDMAFQIVPMTDLYKTLVDADVVYPSTAAETPILLPDELRHTLNLRHTRQTRLLSGETHSSSSVSSGVSSGVSCSAEMETEENASLNSATPATHLTGLGGLHIVDISVPRNVHPECASLPGVHAYNVDDLKQVVEKNTAKRKKEMLLAEKLLRDELWRFQTWQHALTAIPTITKLQEKAESYRQEEVNKVVHKWSQLSPKDLSLVDKLTKGIVAKLLHGPMHHLRSAAACHSATPGSSINGNNKDLLQQQQQQHPFEGGAAVGGGSGGGVTPVSSSSHLFHPEALVNALSGHHAIVQVQRAFQLE